MLYGEAKAEQQFLSLINAAVSHELRNPLNSLIGQVESLKSTFDSFEMLITGFRRLVEGVDSSIQGQLSKIE